MPGWRIAQVCRVGWPQIGGMERLVHDLSAALVRRGHEVTVFTLDRGIPEGQPLPPGEHEGVRYRRLRRLGPRRYPFARGLLQAVRGHDLAHAHGLDGLADTLILGRAWTGVPVGVSTHGGPLHTPRHRALKHLWLRGVSRPLLARADAVWFTSQADREALGRFGIEGRVLPNGVAIAPFEAIRRRPEPGRWLALGRVDVHKGLDDLVETLGALTALDPRPFHLEVIGPERSPGLVRRLRDRCRALDLQGRVTFLGPRTDEEVREALARCELALFPSRYEGFGIVVVEAMAAGVPVVVSPIPAFDALVRPEVDGFRLDFRRPGPAARALADLRSRDISEVSEAARRAARDHGWEVRVLQWESAYRDVLGRKA